MSRILYLPDNSHVVVADHVSDSDALVVARQRYPDAFSAPKEVAAPKPPEKRGWGEAVVDTGASLGKGIGSLMQLPSQAAGLLTGDMEPGFIGKAGKSLEDYSQSLKSQPLLAKEAAQQAKIKEAYETGGIGKEMATAVGSTITDPALLTSFLAEQIPNFIGSLGTGLVAKLGVGAAKSIAGVAAKEAAKSAAKAGVAASVATGVAMQATDVGADTYQQVYDRLKQTHPEMDDAQMRDFALSKGRTAAAQAAVISAGTQFIPGAQTIEKAVLARGLGKEGATEAARQVAKKAAAEGAFKRGVKGVFGEAIPEGIEEGPGGQLLTNMALQEVDPSQRLGQGVGAATGMGALAGGVFGGIGGASNRPAPPPPSVADAEGYQPTPFDQKFHAAVAEFSKSIADPSDAVYTAAAAIIQHAQPGDEMTVFGHDGTAKRAQVTGSNQAGIPLIRVEGDQQFVLGQEFSLINPISPAYKISSGETIGKLDDDALQQKVDLIYQELVKLDESGVYTPKIEIDSRDLTALMAEKQRRTQKPVEAAQEEEERVPTPLEKLVGTAADVDARPTPEQGIAELSPSKRDVSNIFADAKKAGQPTGLEKLAAKAGEPVEPLAPNIESPSVADVFKQTNKVSQTKASDLAEKAADIPLPVAAPQQADPNAIFRDVKQAALKNGLSEAAATKMAEAARKEAENIATPNLKAAVEDMQPETMPSLAKAFGLEKKAKEPAKKPAKAEVSPKAESAPTALVEAEKPIAKESGEPSSVISPVEQETAKAVPSTPVEKTPEASPETTASAQGAEPAAKPDAAALRAKADALIQRIKAIDARSDELLTKNGKRPPANSPKRKEFEALKTKRMNTLLEWGNAEDAAKAAEKAAQKVEPKVEVAAGKPPKKAPAKPGELPHQKVIKAKKAEKEAATTTSSHAIKGAEVSGVKAALAKVNKKVAEKKAAADARTPEEQARIDAARAEAAAKPNPFIGLSGLGVAVNNKAIDDAFEKIENYDLDDTPKSKYVKLAERLVQQGILKEDDLTGLRTMQKDRDMGAEDVSSDLRSTLEYRKNNPIKRSESEVAKGIEGFSYPEGNHGDLLKKIHGRINEGRFNQARARVGRLVAERAAKLGLSKYVNVDMLSNIGKDNAVAGSYFNKLIKLAISGRTDSEIMSVFNHESVHALRELGMITDQEWKNLSAVVKNKGWIKLFNLEERAKMSDLDEDAQVEEAIADAFATYTTGRSPVVAYVGDIPQYVYREQLRLAGQPVGILKRIMRMLGIIKDAANQEGITEAIFKRFETPVEPTKTDVATAPKFSVAPKTDTDAFKNWFGDSKIVNDDGTPKVMYHGTARDITEFRPKQANAIFVTDDPDFATDFSTASQEWMLEHADSILSPEQMKKAKDDAATAIRKEHGGSSAAVRMIADLYGKNRLGDTRQYLAAELEKAMPSAPNVIPLYVKAENPFDYENPAHVEAVIKAWGDKYWAPRKDMSDEKLALKRERLESDLKRGAWSAIEEETAQEIIKSLGHDSFYAKEDDRKNLGVYNSSQLKSATGNVGTYDINNPDIRYSAAPKKKDMTAEQLAQHELNTETKKSAKKEADRNAAMVLSAKPGEQVATVSGITPDKLRRIHERATAIINTKAADAFFKSLGMEVTSHITIDGVWKGQQEQSFFFTAKDLKGNPVPFEKMRALGSVLGWAFQQDAAVTSEVIAKPEEGKSELIPTVYFSKGNKEDLSDSEISEVFKTLGDLGEDGASISIDKKAVKLLYFGDEDGFAKWLGDINEALGDKHGIKGYHIAYAKGNLDEFIQGDTNVYSETDQRLGSKAWDGNASRGKPGIYERATDAFLVPYILAVKAEGGSFDFNRWQKLNNATDLEREALEAKANAYELIVDKVGLTPEEARTVNLLTGRTGLGGSSMFAIGTIGGVKDVVSYLNQERGQTGLRRLDVSNPEDRVTLAKLMTAEALAAKQASGNAIDWYDQEIKKTISIMSAIYPELKTSQLHRLAFTMAMAISSQTMNVEDNLDFAIQQYEGFRKKKVFPVRGSGKSEPAMAGNFEAANKLLKVLGPDDLARFIVTPMTPKELQKGGIKVSGELVNTPLLGSVIFGPKIGYGFLSNLLGNFEPTTFDMWFMRTIGRLTGTLPLFKQEKFDLQYEKMLQSLDEGGQNGVFAHQFPSSLITKVRHGDIEAIMDLAHLVSSAHERDFKVNRALFDAKTRSKSRLVAASENIIKTMEKPKDAPQNGNERNHLREVMKLFVDNVERVNGKRVPPAALQALIWYPEQHLYESLGVKLRVTGQSYSGAAQKVLSSKRLTKAQKDEIKSFVDGSTKPVSFEAFKPFTESEKISALSKLKNNGVDLSIKEDEEIDEEEQAQSQVVEKLSSAPRHSAARILGGNVIAATFNNPKTDLTTDLIYNLQDRFIDLKRVQEEISRTTGGLQDAVNAYDKEALFHNKVAKQTSDFLHQQVRPIIKRMNDMGLTIGELDEYLHNRHAKERNEQVASINPSIPDKGSGIATADSLRYLAALPAGKRADLNAIAAMVDNITKGTRDRLVSSGLEDQGTINAWNSKYQHYVPLQREIEGEDTGTGMGQGFSISEKARRAMGATNLDVHPIFAQIVAARERVIVRAEKNEVAKSVYGLALKAPNPDFFLAVDPSGTVSQADLAYLAREYGLTLQEASNIAQEPMVRRTNPTTGFVESVVNPLITRMGDNVLHLMIDGKEKIVIFNKRNEEANRLAKSLKNIHISDLNKVMSFMAIGTRYFSMMATQMNPIFGVVNLLRDIQGGLLNLTNTPLKDRKAEIFKNSAPAIKGVWKQLRAEANGQTSNDPWAVMFDRFEKAGGPTGYRQLFSDLAKRHEGLEQEFEVLSRGKIKKGAYAVYNAISDYNTAIENGMRLAAFKAALDKGMTDQQAANIAKNLTVNFNRKGAITTQMSALYAFFNASVQGTTRILETLKGPAGKKIIGGAITLGVLQAMALAAAGFDDDQPPEFIKEKNIVIPIGDGKYFTIPMPLGFNILPTFGRTMMELALNGGKDWNKKIPGLLGAAITSVNPLGGGLSLQTMFPTVVDPLVALGENKDAFGRRIYKEDVSGLRPTPGYTRTKETATPWAKGFAEFLNYASGGSEMKQGLLSPTPDQIDYLIGQVGGGVGREISKTAQSISSAVTGEELPTYKIPLASRFYGDTKEKAAESSKFYENLKRLNEHGNQLKYLRTHRGDAVGYLKEFPEARLSSYASSTSEAIERLNKQRKLALERDMPRERIKQLETQMQFQMHRFNERIKAVAQ
jgi:hypothetical protein